LITNNKLKELLAQAIKYSIVGILNTLLGLGSIYFFMAVFNLNIYLSNILGYTIALSNSYILNRKWTFNTIDPSIYVLLKFFIVFIIAFGLQFLSLHLLVRDAVNSYISQALSMFLYIAVGFIGNKYYTFRRNT
jgi:putative flippase GtrA